MTIYDITDDEAGGWRLRAACRGKDTELFFPAERSGPATAAKALCRDCPVKQACLEEHFWEPVGIFGGLTHDERVTLRRGRPRDRQSPSGPFNPGLCGTAAGVDQHRTHGQEPCRPCRDAKNARRRELRALKKQRDGVAA